MSEWINIIVFTNVIPYDCLPSTVPFGLIRFGVAPDHPEVKAVTANFEKVFAVLFVSTCDLLS